MIQCEDRISCLKNTELFKELDEESLEKLAKKLKTRVYPPNTAIVREGAPGDSMFIIKAGRVEVRKRDPSLGIALTIANLDKGACFGEMALLTGKPRSATCVAVEETEVFVLDKKDFEELLKSHPQISIALNRIVAERIEDINSQKGLGFISLSKYKLDKDVVSLLPRQTIKRYKILPISYSNGTLTLAMVNPSDLLALDEVRKVIKGVAIEVVVMSETEFNGFMEKDYPKIVGEKKKAEKKDLDIESILGSMESLQLDMLKEAEYEERAEEDFGVTDLAKEAEGAPIVRLTNTIIAMALKKGASDIHIEPMEKSIRVRYRIDGVLREEMILPKKVALPLVSRIKIISRLDITERRLPQDGRITLKIGDRSIDFRVSTIPTKFGEKVCTRILDKSASIMSLDKLIIHKEVLKLVRDMISKPYGIIYVTGPTGSGKTTTLYSCLSEKNSVDVNISTVEDPIEYDIPGINQVQVNPDIGLDFARVLRAFLRQDPDIILVGETRDQETAKIAVEAALTGHLVFTTLHANDAPSTFMRLTEMGIEPFLISTSVIGVIAQRLVRRVCENCKESYVADKIVCGYLGLKEGSRLYRGKGCEVCGMTGYKGRVGVYEVLAVNDRLRRLIAEGAETSILRKAACENGMMTLKDYCLFLLKEGLTTVDEVLRTVVVQS
ncbi:MAG: ATPase, T2SS/T4P/T4SS family [Deltaproteobacteria bacterium]|nr:ATPase, T2SS/T4P/T4SS family [Deltaproteobacteria bacterium]